MISKFAVIESDHIGQNVEVAEYAIIRKNVKIGENVIIHPFAIIEEGVEIGSNVEIFSHAIVGKSPKGPGLANKPSYQKYAKIGDYCVIGPNAVIYYGDEIGFNTLIGDGVSIRENCKIGDNCVIGRNVTMNFGVTIGNSCRVMDLTHITGRAIIENNVFIGPGVSSADDNKMGRGEDYNPSEDKGVHIKNGASIGEGCVLLPKITIGEHSIIGAGTVVRKNIRENKMVIGNVELLKTDL